MIVIDASAALSGLLNDGAARRVLATERFHVPHLIEPEVASGLRRQVGADRISAANGWRALATWRRPGMTRYPMQGLLDRIWRLRDDLSAYDACYVALAESLNCTLVTADARLSRPPGVECSITTVPR